MAGTDLQRVKRNLNIVEDVIAGIGIADIAKKNNLSKVQIYNVLSDKEYRRILRAGQKEQVLMIPKANKAVNSLLVDEDKNIKLKAAQTVYKNTGITPTHTQNTFIGHLNVENNNMVSAELLGILSEVLNINTVDAEFSEIEDDNKGSTGEHG